jgi:hypothetical protein
MCELWITSTLLRGGMLEYKNVPFVSLEKTGKLV